MKRRRFLSLLSLAPIAPTVAKLAVSGEIGVMGGRGPFKLDAALWPTPARTSCLPYLRVRSLAAVPLFPGTVILNPRPHDLEVFGESHYLIEDESGRQMLKARLGAAMSEWDFAPIDPDLAGEDPA